MTGGTQIARREETQDREVESTVADEDAWRRRQLMTEQMSSKSDQTERSARAISCEARGDVQEMKQRDRTEEERERESERRMKSGTQIVSAAAASAHGLPSRLASPSFRLLYLPFFASCLPLLLLPAASVCDPRVRSCSRRQEDANGSPPLFPWATCHPPCVSLLPFLPAPLTPDAAVHLLAPCDPRDSKRH